MARYRHGLPLTKGGRFLTDGGMETTLIFLEGQELPHFASFVLLSTPEGRQKLKDYAGERRATILFASHNMSEVERLADRVILRDAGRIIEDDTPRMLIEAYGRETLEEVFLDVVRRRAQRGDRDDEARERKAS